VLRLIRGYYLATPIFFLADFLFGVSVRVAFLDQWPAGKIVYYILAFMLGIIAWRRPQWTAQIGLIDSTTNIALIILSVAVWYFGVLDAAGAEFALPTAPSSQELLNFVLSATIAAASYIANQARALGMRSRA
jgi:hypothetical protein